LVSRKGKKWVELWGNLLAQMLGDRLGPKMEWRKGKVWVQWLEHQRVHE